MEIHDINLRLGRVLPDNHPPSPPIEVEEENEESNTQIQQPPFAERLIHSSQHNLEMIELLEELKTNSIKIPLH